MILSKRLKISLSVLAIIALFAFLVFAGDSHYVTKGAIYSVNASTNVMAEFGLLRHDPTVRDINLSGTLSNLSFAIDKSGSIVANEKISNISIMWQLRSNNSFMLNITLSNRTGSPSCPVVGGPNCNNMSSFNVSVDTIVLPDGTYNLTVFLYNFSEGPGTINATNVSLIVNITIDNTPPVTVVTLTNNTVVNVTPVDGATFTHLGAFNQTLAVNVTDAFTGVKNVSFSFTNATVQAFNLSANNRSGVWEVKYNFSGLRAGAHTVTVFAFDFAQSLNKTRTYSFTLNTPMNVTALGLVNRSSNSATGVTGQTFTLRSGLSDYVNASPSSNRTFNISIRNSTMYVLTDQVILQFDNASGLDFNYTANLSSLLIGESLALSNGSRLYHASFNVSNLRAGQHIVTIFANDSLSNVNRTEVFTFTVNTPMNVSSMVSNSFNNTVSIESKNFTELVYNKTFNISVQNSTAIAGMGTVRPDSVILMFNTNATPFNRTMSSSDFIGSGASGYAYYTLGVNLTGMSEGHHAVTIFVNDTWGNLNQTQNISFTIDKTAPTVSVSCSPTSVAPSATVTCDCTASDATSGLTGYHFGNGQRSETPPTSTVGSYTSSTCTATDYAGHTSTASATYTVASSGGSGSSGAGGGSSSGSAGQFEKKVWASINAGETASVSVKNGVMGVTEVSFSVPSTVWGVWVQVGKKEALPKSVAAFTGKVYRNLEITKGVALKDELLKEAKVEFKVEKAWLLENKLTKEAVALHRYKDSAWAELATRVAQEDEAYVHYVADTPGFSYFVIGVKAGLAAPAAEAPAAEAPSAEVPVAEAPVEEVSVAAELKKLNTVGWVAALVAAVVIIAAVLIYLKRRR